MNCSEPLFGEWAGDKAVLDGKWKYVSSDPDYKDELYDYMADPHESNNLFTNSKYREKKSELQLLLKKEIKKQKTL